MSIVFYDPEALPSAYGRKVEREAEIVAAVVDGWRTYQEIGDRYGITRERVRQIAARNGVERKDIPTPARPRLGTRLPCPVCRERVPQGGIRAHRQRAGHPSGKVLDTALVVRLYQAGVGAAAIGQALGCSCQTVLRRLRAEGEPVRRTGPNMPVQTQAAILREHGLLA